jgi:hypothetical protein
VKSASSRHAGSLSQGGVRNTRRVGQHIGERHTLHACKRSSHLIHSILRRSHSSGTGRKGVAMRSCTQSKIVELACVASRFIDQLIQHQSHAAPQGIAMLSSHILL